MACILAQRGSDGLAGSSRADTWMLIPRVVSLDVNSRPPL